MTFELTAAEVELLRKIFGNDSPLTFPAAKARVVAELRRKLEIEDAANET